MTVRIAADTVILLLLVGLALVLLGAALHTLIAAIRHR